MNAAPLPDSVPVHEVAAAQLPILDHGLFDIRVYKTAIGDEHVALVKPYDEQQPVLVRLHSECLTGDVFGSLRCDCGEQLAAALSRISENGGILIYLRQEGRGIGLANKIKAYMLQEQGLDTVEANHQLGFAADQRDYRVAGQILRQLGAHRVRLLTNNPRKIDALTAEGIELVERVGLEIDPRTENSEYLAVKKRKLGHLLTRFD